MYGQAGGAGQRYNVYDINGVKVLTNAKNLDNLLPGVYIVNGRKQVINKH